MFHKLVTTAFLSVLALNVSAQAYTCEGSVSEIKIWNKGGYVATSLGPHNKVWLLCELGADPGCNGTLSLMQVAKVSGKDILLRFEGNLIKSCDDLPAWSVEVRDEFDFVTLN